MAVTNCGFQADAFQADAFQACIEADASAGTVGAWWNARVLVREALDPDEEEALLMILLGIAND